MLVYMLVLRLVHIIASVCWAGGAIIYFFFVEPTAKALAPGGMQFVQYMVTKRFYSVFMAITSTLTVLSGALLLWRVASNDWLGYLQTGRGVGFALGSIAGIVVYFIGMLGVKPRAERLAALGKEIQMAGGPPNPAQAAELHRLDREMSTYGLADFLLVAVALALMASARYF